MKYNKEDYNYVKSWLDKCVTVKKDNSIYYVTSDNILRQLKYNSLFENKKEIKTDLIKLNYKDNVILRYNIKTKYVFVNYYKIWLNFYEKYQPNFTNVNENINDILNDILDLKEYTIYPEVLM